MGETIGTQIVSPEPNADGTQQTATGVETPDPITTIPEKFGGDVAKLAEAYKALELKQSTGTPAATEAELAAATKAAADKTAADKAAGITPEVKPVEVKPVEVKPDVEKNLNIEKEVYYGTAIDTAMEGAGLKPQDVATEWADNQALSVDTYAALEKAGYDRTIVDTYIAGFEGKVSEATALQESQIAEVQKIAGGEEGFNRMTEWAGANLDKGEVDSFNAIMDGGDANMVNLAVRGMNAKYVQAVGQDPNLVQGGASGGSDVFDSHLQVSIAMKAARESGDPAQIHAVEQKALRSPAL